MIRTAEDPRQTEVRDPLRTERRVDAVLDYLFLISLGLQLLIIFGYTTMFSWMVYISGDEVLWLRLATLVTAGARAVRVRDWRPSALAGAAVICLVLGRSMQCVDRWWVLELAALAVGVYRMDFRRVLRLYLCVCVTALLVTVVLALAGVVENLTYERSGRTRYSFGIVYPTDFAARVFFLTAAYVWLRERAIRWWELAVVLGLGAFCLVFCDARNTVLCLALLAVGLGYVKLRRTLAEKRGGGYAMNPVIGWLCCASAPIFALAMVLLSRYLDYGNRFLLRLDGLLSYRLTYGWLAFAFYPVTLFGQNVYLSGWGGVSEITPEMVYSYFFLDSSYVNTLFCFGLVTLLLVLGMFVFSAAREKRNGSWERLIILAAVALQCMNEHHLIDFGYNIFLLLPLAASSAGPLERFWQKLK